MKFQWDHKENCMVSELGTYKYVEVRPREYRLYVKAGGTWLGILTFLKGTSTVEVEVFARGYDFAVLQEGMRWELWTQYSEKERIKRAPFCIGGWDLT